MKGKGKGSQKTAGGVPAAAVVALAVAAFAAGFAIAGGGALAPAEAAPAAAAPGGGGGGGGGGGSGKEQAAAGGKAAEKKSGTELHRGWNWSTGRNCRASDVQLALTSEDRALGRASEATVARAVNAFRECGVLAIKDVMDVATVEEFKRGLDKELDPFLESRRRVREAFRESIRQRITLEELWEHPDFALQSELLFAGGQEYRERNDGRIDFGLPFEEPFNDRQVTFNPYVYPILIKLLGLDCRLKSIQSVTALTEAEGISMQHWHRDTDVLFAPDKHFAEEDVHNRWHGAHLPPYAINMFVPLVNLTLEKGPTEFTLGSHMWGTDWSQEDEDKAVDTKPLANMGSVILFDYRTIHRGTPNVSSSPRPNAMLIYGRPWWQDVVNYSATNYGGKSIPSGYGSWANMMAEVTAGAADAENADKEKERMFYYFSRLWGQALRKEML